MLLLTRPLWYRSAVLLFDGRHPRFWNFNPAIPVDIVRVKSYVNGFCYPMPMCSNVCLTMLVSPDTIPFGTRLNLLTRVQLAQDNDLTSEDNDLKSCIGDPK